MQAIQSSMQTVNPKPSDAQVQQQLQAQIDNLHWSQKQNELSASFNRQQAAQQLHIEHEHFMVEHLAQPIMAICVFALIAAVVVYLARKSIAAGLEKSRVCTAAGVEKHRMTIDADVQKNRDDNAADVQEARRTLEDQDDTAA